MTDISEWNSELFRYSGNYRFAGLGQLADLFDIYRLCKLGYLWDTFGTKITVPLLKVLYNPSNGRCFLNGRSSSRQVI